MPPKREPKVNSKTKGKSGPRDSAIKKQAPTKGKKVTATVEQALESSIRSQALEVKYQNVDGVNEPTSSSEPAYQPGWRIPERTREKDSLALIQARKAHKATQAKRLKDKRLKDDKAKKPPVIVTPYDEEFTHPYNPSSLDLGILYDESLYELPSDHDPLAVHPKGSGVGFPNDESLSLEDFEDETHINHEDPDIIQLAEDLRDIQLKPIDQIPDAILESVAEEHNQIKERFRFHSRTMARIRVTDADATATSYSEAARGKAFKEAVDAACGEQPTKDVEGYATAHVILGLGPKVLSRVDRVWTTARNLAQQALASNPELVKTIQNRLVNEDLKHDPALKELLDILRDVNKQKNKHPYHQALRDKCAVDNGLFDHIPYADIVIVLDKGNRLIAGQLAEVFRQLLKNRGLGIKVHKAFDTYSTLHPVPLPDATRHGDHWRAWLRAHPEFDYRNPKNDQRKAKSGTYHGGQGAMVGDPHGTKGTMSKPDFTTSIANYPHVLAQQEKLRYSAFGGCTEVLKFMFKIWDPALYDEYMAVSQEIAAKMNAETGGNDFETRRDGDPFTMRALLINLLTTDHQDESDWQNGIAGLVAVGDYEGGDLLLREFGLRIEAPPNSAQVFRGREAFHSISYWDGSGREVVVCVTSEAVRRAAQRLIKARNESRGSMGSP